MNKSIAKFIVLLMATSVFACATKSGAQIISTVAGTGTYGFSGDGAAATAAELSLPTGVAVDAGNNIYFSDNANNRIRKISAAGVITTIAGDGPSSGAGSYGGDGGAAISAQINSPGQVAIDGAGNLYIADTHNSRIRKVSTSGIISTIAGSDSCGFAGDGAAATLAKLNYPAGVVVDASGNVYISDTRNNRIRKVSATGIITTIAGTDSMGFSGDGGAASAAELRGPGYLTLDGSGNLYFTDGGNNRVRKISTGGTITTIAGNGPSGAMGSFGGDGGQATAAQLNGPTSVAIDGTGNIYISDGTNQRIRKITPAGVISTFTGNGVQGYAGDGGPAASAELTFPVGVAVDATGNLFITDWENQRVRKVNIATLSVDPITNMSENISIYPNPNSGMFAIAFSGYKTAIKTAISTITGKILYQQTGSGKSMSFDLSGYPSGTYFITANADGTEFNSKIIINQ